MSILQQFTLLCDKYPYITQGVVSGMLQVTGDVLVQKCIKESGQISTKRCYNFMLTGLVSGIVYRKWFAVLENNFQDPKPFINAFGRVAADNVVLGTRTLGTITTLVGSLQTGESMMMTLGLLLFTPKYQHLWYAAKFLNFYFMPLQYQVILNTTFAVIFNIYFNIIKRMVTVTQVEIVINDEQFD